MRWKKTGLQNIHLIVLIGKCNSLEIEKEMKRIADNIFGYNPKTDPRDPLFRKTLSWSVKKEGKGKKNEKND